MLDSILSPNMLQTYSWANLLIELLIRSSAVLSVFWVLNKFLGNLSAAFRSNLWTLALVILLVLPATIFVSPLTRLSIVPDISSTSGDLELLLDEKIHFAKTKVYEESCKLLKNELAATPNEIESMLMAPESIDDGWRLWKILYYLWLSGMVVYPFSVLFLQLLSIYIQKKSWKIESSDIIELAAQSAIRLAIKRNITLLASKQIEVAVTAGLVNPKIIIPEKLLERGNEDLAPVILHEMAHIKRYDYFIELLLQLIGIIFWFNPLYWVFGKRLRMERERACDDIVLVNGIRPSVYAEQLMQVAADLNRTRRNALMSVTLSQGSSLKERLLCILNPKVNRHNEGSLIGGMAIIFLSLLILPVTTLQFSENSSFDINGTIQNLQVNRNEPGILIKGLKHKNIHIRQSAAGLIYHFDRNSMINLIDWVIYNEGEEIRRTVLEILAERDVSFLSNLLNERRGSSEDYRKNALFENEFIRYKNGIDSVQSHIDQLGQRLLHDGYIEEAIMVYKLYAQQFAESSSAFLGLGKSYLYNDQNEIAVQYLRKALELNPHDYEAEEFLSMIKD